MRRLATALYTAALADVLLHCETPAASPDSIVKAGTVLRLAHHRARRPRAVGPLLAPSPREAAHRSEPQKSAAMAATLGIPANATCTAVAVDALALMPTLDSTSRMMKVLQRGAALLCASVSIWCRQESQHRSCMNLDDCQSNVGCLLDITGGAEPGATAGPPGGRCLRVCRQRCRWLCVKAAAPPQVCDQLES